MFVVKFTSFWDFPNMGQESYVPVIRHDSELPDTNRESCKMSAVPI